MNWSDLEDNQLLDELELNLPKLEIVCRHNRSIEDIFTRQIYLAGLFYEQTSLSLLEISRIVGIPLRILQSRFPDQNIKLLLEIRDLLVVIRDKLLEDDTRTSSYYSID